MSDCVSLEALLTSLTNEVSDLRKRVAKLERERSDWASKSDLKKLESWTQGELVRVGGELAKLIKYLPIIAEIAKTVLSLVTKIELIEKVIDLIRSLLGRNDLEPRVQALEIQVSSLDIITQVHNRQIALVKERVGIVEKDLANFKTDTAGKLARHESTLIRHETAITRHESTLVRHERELVKYKGILDKHETTLVRHEVTLTTHGITLLSHDVNLKVINASLVIVNATLVKHEIDLVRHAVTLTRHEVTLIYLLTRTPLNGRDGKDGRDGKNGKDGRDGLNGNGRDGKDGRDGKNGKNGKDAEVEFTTIVVKIFDGCTNDTPRFKYESVSVIKGLEAERAKEFEQIANGSALKCAQQAAIAILPEHHQIRTGSNIPQASILWRGLKADGSFTNDFRASTIPHYNKDKKPVLQNHTKGSHYARIILKDNSRIVVYAESQSTAERVAREQLKYVDASFIPSPIKVSLGERKGEELAKITVKAVRVSYFSKGLKDTQPDWVSEL